MTDHPSADAARIREIREQLTGKAAALDAQVATCDHFLHKSPIGCPYCKRDTQNRVLLLAAADALARSEQARQDLEAALSSAGIHDDHGTLRWVFNPGRQEVSAGGGAYTDRLLRLFQQVRFLVDEMSRRNEVAEQARQEAEHYMRVWESKTLYEERRANTLRDERNKCTEAARLNGTADVAALRAELERLRGMLKEIEWAGVVWSDTPTCLFCSAHRDGLPATSKYPAELPLTHKHDCRWAALASTPPSHEPKQ